VFHSLREYGKAKEYLEKALAMKKETGDKNGEASSYANLGTVFKSLKEYGKAKEYLEKELAIRNEISDRNGEASCHENLGTVFCSLGENRIAIENHEKALAIRKETGDRNGEALCCRNLGAVLCCLGEYGKAKEYFEKALAIRKEMGDRKGEAAVYEYQGTVFHSLWEYGKAKEYLEKALAIRKEIGDREGEATDYGKLGTVFHSLRKYGKAKEYLEKKLSFSKEIGDKEGEAADYGNLGSLFHSLKDYGKAKEYLEKALAIRKEIGDMEGEATDYRQLGTVFHSLEEYGKAKEYLKKALAIRKAIGDMEGEATDYGTLGHVFHCRREYGKAQEYLEKALAIRKEIGNREGEAFSYAMLGDVFCSLGELGKAKECYNEALGISKDFGKAGTELTLRQRLFFCPVLKRDAKEAVFNLHVCIKKFQDIRGIMKGYDEFKISFSDEHASPFRMLSGSLCINRLPTVALCLEELIRGRALADLLSAQYCVESQVSGNPLSWACIERIIGQEKNCLFLYISYSSNCIFLWVLNPAKATLSSRQIFVDKISIKDLRKFLGSNITFRMCQVPSEKHCENRSLFPGQNEGDLTQPLHQKRGLTGFRPVEEDEEVDQEPEPTLSLYYQLIIAPVADELDEPEIIIVPDRCFYNVPFVALKDEHGTFLTERFRIRIIPSLTTLEIIQACPLDYHSQTGALIVGDPEVGHVTYKGRLEWIPRLPCATREAEMIGHLLNAHPLLGKHATKKTVLEKINSVCLIHFAAHGNAERGEIALAPLHPTNGYPREEDYLLTMADISKVQVRAKLVVLSCCHSASGHVRSEGVIGIARAFLGSGARSVLVALWALEDSATQQLMSRFYEHLVRGESASESLHQAMKWMRENDYSNVRDWAPFMLIGDDVTFDFAK